MKLVFLVIIILHGLIHTIGFFKAFRLAKISQLTQPIPKPIGIIWLLTFFLFIVVAVQVIANHDLWWIAALSGTTLSQILIISFWHDARFGTIPNVIILLIAIVAFANWNFKREVNNEIIEMFSKNLMTERKILNANMIEDLPKPVQKWLKSCGAVGKEMIHSVRLKQKGEMGIAPEQENWYTANAEQYFTIDKPSFIWIVKVDMMPLVFFAGRDFFAEGKGKMLIKALSLINIVNAANEKINQSTLQRYLGEIVWFPTAAVSQYIKWQEIDSLSAKATMTYYGLTGSAEFHFNSNGDFEKFSTMRYMGNDNKAALKEWVITVKENRIINGLKIPVKFEVNWKLESGDFKWYKLEVHDVEYNKPVLWK